MNSTAVANTSKFQMLCTFAAEDAFGITIPTTASGTGRNLSRDSVAPTASAFQGR